MVTELTADIFKKEIEGQIPLIIDFWASWCGPCKMLAPLFEDLSKEYPGRLRFAKISTEDFPQIAEQHDITGIPCLIMFKNGKEVDRIIGFSPKPVLKQKIDMVLANA
ncbi:MAG TPA: thioredoxin [Candidatus Nanoarchaeia archaeon]|nr:thioredoxin [Candidatus Nanoarchaeia archaeon]